jgi:hypothetical protein
MGMEHINRIWTKTTDLAADLGVPYTTAAAWKQRRSIPAKHFGALIVAAANRGETLTLEMLHGDMLTPDGIA